MLCALRPSKARLQVGLAAQSVSAHAVVERPDGEPERSGRRLYASLVPGELLLEDAPLEGVDLLAEALLPSLRRVHDAGQRAGPMQAEHIALRHVPQLPDIPGPGMSH